MKISDSSLASGSPSPPERSERTLVIHLVPQSLNRGAQIYAANLRDSLRGDLNQEHLLVALFEGPDGRVRPDVNLGVPVGPLRRVLDPRAVFSLRRLVKNLRADLVVAHGGEALKYAVAAGGTGLIYKRTGLSTTEISRPGRALLYRILCSRARLVVGVSQELLEQAHGLLRVPRERLVYIPNSRDPEVYRPLQHGEPALPGKRILFVGQLEPGKRPELFLDVVEALRETAGQLEAAMVGDGQLREAIAQRAVALGVNLLGVRTDVPELIRASDVVVMTSAPGTEGMPGVLIEAGLSGVPVVATRAAGVGDVVEHGVTGWIVDGTDPLVIAGHVGVLLADAALRQTQGTAARERCRKLFSIEATSDEWRSLIAESTSTPRRRRSFTNGGMLADEPRKQA